MLRNNSVRMPSQVKDFSMNQHPFLTIVIPTHSRPNLLRRTLLSIKNQSFKDVQIIVVSDTQDQETFVVCNDCLASSDVFVRRSGKPGPSDSRNLGIRMALGRYIMFIDDDDAYEMGSLEKIYSSLAYSTADIAYFDCIVVKEMRKDKEPIYLGEVKVDLSSRYNDDLFVKNSIHMSSIAFPKYRIENQLFDPHMRAYEDWDFMLSVMKSASVTHIPLLATRVHEVNEENSDRRGSSTEARDFNAILDYLYVYRRHPAPNNHIREKRRQLMKAFNIDIPTHCL